MQYMPFCDIFHLECLPELSMLLYVRCFFLVKIEKCSIVHTFCILFSYSFIDGSLGCFHILVIVNNTAMDISGQISLWIPAFNSFEYVPRSGTARSYGNPIFNFLRNCHSVSHSDKRTIWKSSVIEIYLFIHSFTLLSTNWGLALHNDYARLCEVYK